MNGQRHKEQELLSKEDIQNWIKNGADLEKMKRLQKWVRKEIKGLSNSSIRRYYGEILRAQAFLNKPTEEQEEQSTKKQLEQLEEAYKRLLKLKVILAYDIGRTTKEKERKQLMELSNQVNVAIDKLKDLKSNKEAFSHFFFFMEALLAFHREIGKN